MKNLKNIGFGKLDEMEKNIVLRAQRNALVYVVLALVAWSLYESFQVYIQHTRINLVPCFLLVSTSLVQSFSQLFLKRQAVKDDVEYSRTNPCIKIFLTVVVAAGIIASISSWLMISGK